MSNDGSGYRPSAGERIAREFMARKLMENINGHGTAVSVDWDRLGRELADSADSGDSDREVAAMSEDKHKLILPFVPVGVSLAPPPDAVEVEPEPAGWKPRPPTEAERIAAGDLYLQMRHHPEQGRPRCKLHPALAYGAHFRAQYMQEHVNGPWGNLHLDADGYGPNYHARRAGYAIHHSYGVHPAANNIESITINQPSIEAAWKAFLNSPGHREHLLGVGEFYGAQTNVGIGVAIIAPHYHWIVVWSAHPEGAL